MEPTLPFKAAFLLTRYRALLPSHLVKHLPTKATARRDGVAQKVKYESKSDPSPMMSIVLAQPCMCANKHGAGQGPLRRASYGTDSRSLMGRRSRSLGCTPSTSKPLPGGTDRTTHCVKPIVPASMIPTVQILRACHTRLLGT